MKQLTRRFSWIALFLCYLLLVLTALFYYPKWSNIGTNATISWDVSGYYWYLPALFIHDDLTTCTSRDTILKTYGPTPDFQQGFFNEDGVCVMKYSCGQALQYLPAFLLAHWYASSTDVYPADGFSYPYQLAIGLNSLLVALLGLFLLRLFLRLFFDEITTGLTLIAITFGTNYLTYAGISNAMTHNHLFTIYAALLLLTHSFYQSPNRAKAVGIGLLVGLAALTRPTEILAALIPLLWGIEGLNDRLQFLRKHLSLLITAIVCCVLVGSLQLIYWKYATGSWLVYSYEDQGFSWLSPHFGQAMFSYRSGWLTYSPILVFALVGFVPLYRNYRRVFWMALVFCVLFSYVTFAWDIWWYGGSVGQRAMVQSYPVFALPLAAFIEIVRRNTWVASLMGLVGLIFILYNLWVTHQAHHGGLYRVGMMTRAYFWEVVGTFEKQEEDLKLLDTDEDYRGERENVRLLMETGFETDSIPDCGLPPLEGEQSVCLSADIQYSPTFEVPLEPGAAEWIRVSADYYCDLKEWNDWRMAQVVTQFRNGEAVVKSKIIRLHRLLNNGERQRIHQDTRCPEAPYDRVVVHFWNSDGTQRLLVDQLTIEAFDAVH